jgi:hypothetical protein
LYEPMPMSARMTTITKMMMITVMAVPIKISLACDACPLSSSIAHRAFDRTQSIHPNG